MLKPFEIRALAQSLRSAEDPTAPELQAAQVLLELDEECSSLARQLNASNQRNGHLRATCQALRQTLEAIQAIAQQYAGDYPTQVGTIATEALRDLPLPPQD